MTMVALLALIHILAGFHLTRHFWRPRRLSDLPAAWIVTAMATFYGGPILLGTLTGRINRWTVVASAAAACALALAARLRDPDPVFTNRDIRAALCGMGRGERAQWALIGIILAATLALGSVLPIRMADAAEYHSINPMRWAQTHRFDLRSFGANELNEHITAGEVSPNVKAVLPFLVLEYTGREDGTALAQWPFLLLLVACLFGISKRLRIPGWAGATAILFTLLAPEVLLQSLESYADLAFFAGQMAVVWGCIVAWDEGPSRRGIGLTALGFAFLVGSKATALVMAAAMGVVFLYILCLKRREEPTVVRLTRITAGFGAVIVACLVFAGPWYVRGLLVYSNPVYPYEVKIGGRVVFPGVYAQDVGAYYARQNQKAEGLTAWWRVMNESHRPPILAGYLGGLGAHALILGLPALVLLLGAGLTRGRWRVYAPVLILFAVLFLTSAVRVWPRMILFELAVYGLAFAWLLAEIPKPLRVLFFCLFGILGMYNVARTIPATLYATRPPELAAFPYLTGHRRQAQVDKFPDEFTSLDYWREHLGTKGRVMALPQLWSWYARPLNSGASVVRVPRVPEGGDVEAWADTLLSLGATHLYAQKKIPEFSAALSNPDRFRLLFRRLDSGAESPWGIHSSDEDAVFEILPRKGGGE